MPVYPKSKQLNVAMKFCSWAGIIPWEIMFDNNPYLQTCYSVYSKVILTYYTLLLGTCYIQLFKLLNDENKIMGEISGNLCITLIYTTTLLRMLVIRFYPRLRNIIKQIIDTEKVIYAQDDKEVTNIYNNTAKDTNRKCILFIIVLIVITILYISKPLIQTGYDKQIGNQTIFIRPLPLSAWLPFDEQTFYLTAYVWQILDCMVLAPMLTFTDTLVFTLIAYPSGQLKILQHVLKNFEMYKQKIQIQSDIEDEDIAAYVTFRACIKQHKNIIQYVDYFNDSMKELMVFDFVQSSLQIATILTQVLGNELTFMFVLYVGTTFMGMLLRLYYFYFYADKVINLSSGLSIALWESNWYEQTPKIKFMMLFFMMKTQKPLTLNIGPFSDMSLESFITIMKGTYSYIMLMYGKNGAN